MKHFINDETLNQWLNRIENYIAENQVEISPKMIDEILENERSEYNPECTYEDAVQIAKDTHAKGCLMQTTKCNECIAMKDLQRCPMGTWPLRHPELAKK